jgi:hypothetical protein
MQKALIVAPDIPGNKRRVAEKWMSFGIFSSTLNTYRHEGSWLRGYSVNKISKKVVDTHFDAL